jgi:hypothetical protein
MDDYGHCQACYSMAKSDYGLLENDQVIWLIHGCGFDSHHLRHILVK